MHAVGLVLRGLQGPAAARPPGRPRTAARAQRAGCAGHGRVCGTRPGGRAHLAGRKLSPAAAPGYRVGPASAGGCRVWVQTAPGAGAGLSGSMLRAPGLPPCAGGGMGLQATPSTFKQSSSALKPLRYSGLYKISLSFLEGKKKSIFLLKTI